MSWPHPATAPCWSTSGPSGVRPACLSLRAPVLEHVIQDLAGTLGLAKLEVDQGDNMKLAGQHRVRGFPTVILFDGGQEAGRFSGARSRTQILTFIKDHVDIADPI